MGLSDTSVGGAEGIGLCVGGLEQFDQLGEFCVGLGVCCIDLHPVGDRSDRVQFLHSAVHMKHRVFPYPPSRLARGSGIHVVPKLRRHAKTQHFKWRRLGLANAMQGMKGCSPTCELLLWYPGPVYLVFTFSCNV